MDSLSTDIIINISNFITPVDKSIIIKTEPKKLLYLLSIKFHRHDLLLCLWTFYKNDITKLSGENNEHKIICINSLQQFTNTNIFNQKTVMFHFKLCVENYGLIIVEFYVYDINDDGIFKIYYHITRSYATLLYSKIHPGNINQLINHIDGEKLKYFISKL